MSTALPSGMTARFHAIRIRCLLLLVITALSFATFFRGYSEPSQLLWDEAYSIPNAQKYLNRIFFIHEHPPLGKLLIALGEDIMNANLADDQLIGRSKAKGTPGELSLAGYRLFPALCAWLSAPLLFLLVLSLTESPARAFLVALAYSLQNALVVHLRLAVLDGVQIFCMLCTLCALAVAHRRAQASLPLGIAPLFAGIFFSAALATKVTALIVALAFMPLFLVTRGTPRRLVVCALQITLGFVVTHYIIWQLHFSLGQHIHPSLPNHGFYSASARYREILLTGAQNHVSSFPTMLREALSYLMTPHEMAPALNLCKPDENGSPTWSWPFGGRSISYSWYDQGNQLRPRVLQVNPISWMIGLAGVIFAGALVLGRRFLDKDCDRERPIWLYTYLAMWIGYMTALSSLNRVFYLYHYFIPFLFSLILAVLVWPYIRLSAQEPQTRRILPWVNYGALIQAMLCSFLFFAPMTYGSLMTKEEINARGLLSLWDLRCPGCPITNRFTNPLVTRAQLDLLSVRIGKLKALGGWQQFGSPQVGKTVLSEPIVVRGVTAKNGINTLAASSFAFPLNRNYKLFTGKVGLPDYSLSNPRVQPSLRFLIRLDSTDTWQSEPITVDNQSGEFSVSVAGAALLEIAVESTANSTLNAHAVWFDLALE